jgi:hypothetical protein
MTTSTEAHARPSGTPIDRPAPESAVDPRTERARHGTYRGALQRCDLSALRPSALSRLVREKRWVYVTFVKAPWMISLAVVDLGYAQTVFGFAHHEARGLVADMRSAPGLPGLSRVRQDGVHRIDARLRGARERVSIRERRGEGVLEVRATTADLELRASLDLRAAAPALTAIAPIRGGIVDVTEKQVLAPLRGAALVKGERIDLDGGLGGFDFTVGLLARETRWNWAFLMGSTDAGEPIALNLVEGFVGPPECAVFGTSSLHALSEGRFTLPRARREGESLGERARHLEPWHVRTAEGECDLVFTPRAVHDESLDLGVVRSRFVQPIGSFAGTIRRGEQTLHISHALGVVEDQDVRW